MALTRYMDHLIMAACEWYLMLLMFIDAAVSSSLTKFAKRCQLELPCLLCSRLGHSCKNEEEPESYSYLHLFCNKHQVYISNLIYCNMHNELVDARDMCEYCFGSATLHSQTNLECYGSCVCCKIHCKETLNDERAMMSDSSVSRVCKATTKPPLPHRHGRSKRVRNKMKHRHRDLLKFTSDSESDFLCSDDDDNRYKILEKHSYSTPDLWSFDECSRTRTTTRARSASLTPSCMIQKKGKYKKPLSSMNSTCLSTDGYGSLDGSLVAHSSGSQNRYNIFSRNSFSAFDLGSAVFLEMNYNKNLPQRSVSLTPKSSADYGLGKHLKNKKNIAKAKKYKKSGNARSSLPPSYGYLDDSLISRRMGNHYHNQNKIPRRHSYSVFQLGSDILLNMPIDESLTSYSLQKDEPDFIFGPLFDFRRDILSGILKKNKGYGSLDDSVISRSSGIQYQNKIPRRHSYSFFELGHDILLNNPFDESIRTHTASLAPNGSASYGFGEPSNFKLPDQRGKKNKKSLQSLDDSFVLCNTGSYNNNNNPRRHSYSAYELGCALLSHMPPFDEGEYRSASLAQPLPPKWPNEIDSSSAFSEMNRGYGSFDDSVVLRKTAGHNHSHNIIPRRHSYSVFHLGGDILLNMPIEESLTSSELLAQRDSFGRSIGHPPKPTYHKGQKDKKTLPPMSSVRGNLSIDKTKWHGNFDDYLVSRSQSQNTNNNPRRHSCSAFDMGPELLVEIHLDKDMPNGSTRHGLGEHNQPRQKAKRNKNLLPPLVPTNVFSSSSSSFDFKNDLYTIQSLDDSVVLNNKCSHNQDTNPRRYSYSDFELGGALLLNMQRDGSLTRPSASWTPMIQQVNERQPTIKFITSELSSTLLYKPHGFGSFDDSFLSHSRKPFTNLTRNFYSATDLTLLDESLAFASAPNYSIQQGLDEFNGLKFQTGPSSSLQKRKKNDRSKGKKNKKPLPSGDNAKVTSSSNVYSNYDSDTQNRYKIFSRNSQSASDLGSLLVVEMHHDDTSRTRSKSLTPNCYFCSPESYKKPEENKRASFCPSCLDKIDLRSLDGISISDFDGDGCLERVKRKTADDVRCMRLLQSELEAERNAATIAANHAMNMITRLQQEKASLQMEALQYLRMMEEQAEYDMEALQKANELVEEKENEIQDLLDELEQYKNKYEDESFNNIKSFEDEKKYVIEAFTTLENKIHQVSNEDHDKSQENENHVDLAMLWRELLDLKEKMEALRADLFLLQHACNTLCDGDGLEFVQDIAHQLQDLRGMMGNRRCIASH